MRDVGLGTGVLGTAALAEGQTPPSPPGLLGPGPVPITLTVNGKIQKLTVEPRVTLLDALRDRLDLTGAKATCDHGTCGTCTVLMNGNAVYACSVLAIDAQGKNIQTIESLPESDPLISSLVRNDATQCGFCASGTVLAAKALLARHPNPTEAQVAAGMNGNLCRCGTYIPVRKAILEFAQNRKGGRNG